METIILAVFTIILMEINQPALVVVIFIEYVYYTFDNFKGCEALKMYKNIIPYLEDLESRILPYKGFSKNEPGFETDLVIK